MVQKGSDSGTKPPTEFSTALELKNFNNLELPGGTAPGGLGKDDMVRCFGFDQGFKRCSLPGDRKITVESKGKRKTYYFCKHSHAGLLEQTGHLKFYSMVYDQADEYDELYSAAAKKTGSGEGEKPKSDALR